MRFLILISMLFFVGCGVDDSHQDQQLIYQGAIYQHSIDGEILTVNVDGINLTSGGDYHVKIDLETNQVIEDTTPYYFDAYHFLEHYQFR